MLAVYIVVVTGMVIITSAILIYLLNKIEMLNYRSVLAVSLGSILSALMFPGIFNVFSAGRENLYDAAQLAFVMATTVVLQMILMLVLSIILSRVIPDSVFTAIGAGLGKRKLDSAKAGEAEGAEAAEVESIPQERNYLEEIYDTMVAENGKEGSDIDVLALPAENNLEISVDSEEIIDKMRIETFEQYKSIPDDILPQIEPNSVIDIPVDINEPKEVADLADDLSLDGCVDEAFRLKSQGDCEGAILYFMYALDRQPGSDLAFWMVLDICVLYKTIGQVEFARDMLSTYFDTYRGMMDERVRDEIERNLIYMDG